MALLSQERPVDTNTDSFPIEQYMGTMAKLPETQKQTPGLLFRPFPSSNNLRRGHQSDGHQAFTSTSSHSFTGISVETI